MLEMGMHGITQRLGGRSVSPSSLGGIDRGSTAARAGFLQVHKLSESPMVGRSISGFLRLFPSVSSARCLILAEYLLWILFSIRFIPSVWDTICEGAALHIFIWNPWQGCGGSSVRNASHCDREHAAARLAQRRHLLIAKRRRVSSERYIELLNTVRSKIASLRLNSRNLYMRRDYPTFDANDGHELLVRRLPKLPSKTRRIRYESARPSDSL